MIELIDSRGIRHEFRAEGHVVHDGRVISLDERLLALTKSRLGTLPRSWAAAIAAVAATQDDRLVNE
jgi:hypothetical protein